MTCRTSFRGPRPPYLLCGPLVSCALHEVFEQLLLPPHYHYLPWFTPCLCRVSEISCAVHRTCALSARPQIPQTPACLPQFTQPTSHHSPEQLRPHFSDPHTPQVLFVDYNLFWVSTRQIILGISEEMTAVLDCVIFTYLLFPRCARILVFW